MIAPGFQIANLLEGLAQIGMVGKAASAAGNGFSSIMQNAMSGFSGRQGNEPALPIPAWSGLETTGKIDLNIRLNAKNSNLFKSVADDDGPLSAKDMLKALKAKILSLGKSLESINAGPEALEALQRLLTKSGFDPQQISKLMESLNAKADSKGVRLSDLFAGLSQLEDPEDSEETQQTLPASAVPFIMNILTDFGMAQDQAQALIDNAKLDGKKISIRKLVAGMKNKAATLPDNGQNPPDAKTQVRITAAMARLGLQTGEKQAAGPMTFEKFASALAHVVNQAVGATAAGKITSKDSKTTDIPLDDAKVAMIKGHAGASRINGTVKASMIGSHPLNAENGQPGTATQFLKPGFQLASTAEASVNTVAGRSANAFGTSQATVEHDMAAFMAGLTATDETADIWAAHKAQIEFNLNGRSIQRQVFQASQTLQTEKNMKAFQKAAGPAGKTREDLLNGMKSSPAAGQQTQPDISLQTKPNISLETEPEVFLASRKTEPGANIMESLKGAAKAAHGAGKGPDVAEDMVTDAKAGAKTNPNVTAAETHVRISQSTQSAGAATAQRPTANTLPAYVLNQVSRKLVNSIRNNEYELRIQLKPPELGRIHLNIDNSHDSLKVSIVAERHNARELLVNHSHELKNLLLEHGLKIEKMNVEVANDFNQFLSDAKQDGSDARGGKRRWNKGSKANGDIGAIDDLPATPRRIDGALDLVA